MTHIPFYCDGCDEPILDVRFKCLHCRDFDLCVLCAKDTSVTRSSHDPATHVLIREEIAGNDFRGGDLDISLGSSYSSSMRTGDSDNPLTEYSILEGMQYFHLNLERIAIHAHTTLDTVCCVIDRIAERERELHVLLVPDAPADAVPQLEPVALPVDRQKLARYTVCSMQHAMRFRICIELWLHSDSIYWWWC